MIAETFSNALKRAIERQLPVFELLAAANSLQAGGELRLAEALYRSWLQYNAGDRLAQAVHFNHGVVLTALHDDPGARDAFNAAIKLSPDFLPPYVNLGGVYDRLGAAGEAVNTWTAMVNRLPAITGENVGYKLAALKQIGRVLERSNFDAQAEEALRHSLDINSQQIDVAQHYVSLRQRQCKWPVIAPWQQVDRKSLLAGISALSLQAYSDDPLFQLGNAFIYGRNIVGTPSASFVGTHKKLLDGPAAPRRRIGYLSSDLREHAIGYLTTEVFELHDREKVEVFAYYCGIRTPDKIQLRIQSAVEHWVDISDMNDETAAKRIVDDGIEILVDVNGYTNGQRTKMLAMRPAPIIVNWLGFPGSVATPYHNYIVADEFIIPPENEMFFSEKVLRLPCYQSNDRKRPVGERPTRAAAGLPEDVMVFCCFNGLHKISKFTWARWMSILTQVPGSVLWLLDGPQSTMDRLRELATAAGVDQSRVIFAKKMRNPDHLARYPLADLFLDTSPYGAHTTSSDALWMAVPLLTIPGRSFASRVCGSLVRAAGMEELICSSSEEYVRMAVELANDRPRLAALRRRLESSRDTCVLFNMPLLVSSLEQLYTQMWSEYRSGNLPVPDLSNLEIYHAIGIELDRDDVEMQMVDDYLGLYRRLLAVKAASLFLNPDPRLWPAPRR